MKKGDKITLKIEFLRGKMQFLRDDKMFGEKSFPPPKEKTLPTTPPPVVPVSPAEKEAKKLQEDWAAKLKLPVEATNKIGMKLMLIPPAGEAMPQAYYLGKYEVTQEEWQQVMGYNPSHFTPEEAKVADTSKFPVETVSWYDCVEYCNKLSEREGLKPYYELTGTKRGKNGKQIEAAEVKILGGSGYRIPREAHWVHGCRAGTNTLYHFGDNGADLPAYAWIDQNSEGRTHAVGEKKPNAFGLYDMHGNAWEWCEDQFESPQGPVRHGGCWQTAARDCAAGVHSNYKSSDRGPHMGFRLARVPSGETTARHALAFSGDKSYVQFPTLKITDNVPFTAEAWAVLDQPGDPGRAVDIIANAAYSGFSLGVAPANHAPPGYAGKAWGMNIFSPKDSETKTYAHAWEKARLPRQQMIHLAGVYDGVAEIRFYVDGRLQSRAPAQDVRPSERTLSLGGNWEGGSGFIGRVCEVRVSKVARYDDKDFTPAKRWENDKDTIALYHFDEGQGDVLKDSSGHGHDGKILGAKWVKVSTTPPPFVPLSLAEKEAKKLQEDSAAKLKVPVETTNEIGMKFVWIPPGHFMMGSPQGRKRQGQTTKSSTKSR